MGGLCSNWSPRTKHVSQEESLKKNLGKYLLIILPILAAGYMLWPTFNFYRLDKERALVAGDSAALEQWERSYGEAYQAARNGRLKLGLDLRGGMYVTLEVDVLRMIEESADQSSIDDAFRDVISKTRAETNNTDLDVLDTFLKNFRTTNRSLLQYFTVTNAADPTDESVIAKLRRDVDGAVDQALQVIKQRINKYEVSEANIQKQGARRILIEMPDVKDEKEIRTLLQTTARLEFKRVLMNRELLRTFMTIDAVLKGHVPDEAKAVDTTAVKDSTATAKDSSAIAKADSARQGDSAKVDTAKKTPTDPYAGLPEEEARRRYRADYPFTSMIQSTIIVNERAQPFSFVGVKPEDFPENAQYRFIIDEKLLPRVLAILERPDIRKVMPVDLDIVVGAKTDDFFAKQGAKVYDVYGVAREPELTGDAVVEAFPSFDQAANQPIVLMEMNAEGAEKWAQITGANIGKRIAIVLDGRVHSAPNVQNKIANGSSQITGMANAEEANLLAVVLKAGALKAPVKIIEERVVGPSLGEDSIRRGVTTSVISFAIVILFMLAYYALGGGVADVALLMNVLLVVAALAAFGGTLTLPGIAGIILSVAMAVDANILVFERIREEMAAGRTLKAAVEQGYAKAMSAIIDSNITHILSSIVLIYLGTGPVKGFALTLIIGVVMTLFTAVLVTRAIFEIIIAGGATTFNFGQKKA